MRKHILILGLLALFLTSAAFAQDTISDFLNQKTAGKPFASIDAYLAQNKQDFDNSDEVVKIFNQERVRLGANFETELWKYLSKDLRKHYWINIFVETEEFLNGNKPLPDLAARIRSNAQDFPVNSDDYELLGMKFTILRGVTVDLYLNKKLDSAKIIKQKAQRIYKDIEQMGVIGATDEFVTCIYENLEKNPGSCRQVNSASSISTTETTNTSGSNNLSGGVLNGRAILLPAPEYPKAASAVRITGTVEVEVIIDEAGDVISAKALTGHPLLQAAAVEAAKQAKFKPTQIGGQLLKVIGTIVYNFRK